MMRNSNNYELVAVICHSGRSKSLGQFYSFVKRNIRFDHLNPSIKRFFKTAMYDQHTRRYSFHTIVHRAAMTWHNIR